MVEHSSSKQESGRPRTLWHRLLGKELELLLTPLDIQVLTEVEVISNPPKADILLLRRNTPAWTPAQLQFLPAGIRSSQAAHILLEFKVRESFNEETLQQAVGYDYFYRQGQQLERSQVATFVVSAQTPQAATLQAAGYQPSEELGVYRSQTMVIGHIGLILLNELEPVLHNAFVQCFATHRQARTAAFQQLRQLDKQSLSDDLWRFLRGLQQQTEHKGGKMSNVNVEDIWGEEELTAEMLIESGRELREFALAHVTKEELLARISPKEILAYLTPEELLAHFSPQERLAGLQPEERLAGLQPEEMVTLLEQIEAYLRAHPIARKKSS